jgi:hypothetical protein
MTIRKIADNDDIARPIYPDREENSNSNLCENCYSELNDDEKFCGNCGHDLDKCPVCNSSEDYDRSANTCLNCGHHPWNSVYSQPMVETKSVPMSPGPAIIKEHVPEPSFTEIHKHLKEHEHPGIENYPMYVDDADYPEYYAHHDYHVYHDNDPQDCDYNIPLYIYDESPEHFHQKNNYGDHGLTLNELFNRQEHPNMRLPADAMSYQTKLKHYQDEHGYLAIEGENLTDYDRLHEDYHKDSNQNLIQLELEWLRAHDFPRANCAAPHMHYQVIGETPEKQSREKQNVDDLIQSVDDISNWREQRRQQSIERRSSRENILSFARKFWNPKQDITLEEYADKLFNEIEPQ